MPQADMGLIGLGVMGQNLALNFSDHHFSLAVYNREKEYTEDFMLGEAKGRAITPCYSHKELVSQLAKPRKIMLMITAGDPVDSTIEALLPLLDKGDIIIDGGNSHFPDTIRRTKSLKEKGILFVGSGISGGEEGARFGPAIMPGGNPEAWSEVQNILQSIAAKVEGEPCCQWIGDGGAGHYVKMVHNGIEYGDMQLITEAYQLMKEMLGMSADEMHQVFKEWNEGDLSSYLIEITRDILAYKDEDGEPLVDKILDTAGQKGTGKWTAVSALDAGVPLTLIGEAVFARCLSAIKDERVEASKSIKATQPAFDGDKKQFLLDLKDAVYASKLVSYAQGYTLMKAAADEAGWNLNYGGIALMWRGGCIIRSSFLSNIKDAYDNNPNIKTCYSIHFLKIRLKRPKKHGVRLWQQQ